MQHGIVPQKSVFRPSGQISNNVFLFFIIIYRLIGRMLLRQPEKRATLTQISADPWVKLASSGDQSAVDAAVALEDSLPLVSRQQLSEEDHTFVVQKMVNGQIASKEQILEALESDEYNHITATYYLLAERKLRAHRLVVILFTIYCEVT